MKTNHFVLTITLALCAALAACKGDSKSEPVPSTTSANSAIDMDKAQAIFNERCSACHGTDGKGTGPAAAALNPKPRNYADKAWQTSVTDDQLRKVITLGGAAVGKSPIMPASPDLDEKPDVVNGLVKIVRKFGN